MAVRVIPLTVTRRPWATLIDQIAVLPSLVA